VRKQNQRAPTGRRLRRKLLVGFADEAQSVAVSAVALGGAVGGALGFAAQPGHQRPGELKRVVHGLFGGETGIRRLRCQRVEVGLGGCQIQDVESHMVQHLFDQLNVEHMMVKGSVLKILQAALPEVL
jgi:hypothetical protein